MDADQDTELDSFRSIYFLDKYMLYSWSTELMDISMDKSGKTRAPPPEPLYSARQGYRVVTAIHFNRQKLYIRHVLTHSEYERWSAKLRKCK